MEYYPLKELLLLEKESSGMYFSGHMIDSYSSHVADIAPVRISDILDEYKEDLPDTKRRFKERTQVSIAGIVSQRKTKVNKNGDTMAFITVEDRYGEIEVIVFAKQYKSFSDCTTVECPVHVIGTVSVEDTEVPKILLSSAEILVSNSDYAIQKSRQNATMSEKRIYVKVPSLADSRINSIYRIATLNRGNTRVVLYDSATGKYSAMRDVTVDPSDRVITRLCGIFSPENVILK
jgi:DNA polymerase-3 subunit alpha